MMKAFSVGWLASIRSQKPASSSTLENSFARRPCRELRRVDCVHEGLHSMTFGTRYRPAATCGALRLIELVVVRFGDHVGSQALRQTRQRMRHRRDTRGVGARSSSPTKSRIADRLC